MSQLQSQFVFRAMTPRGGKTFGVRAAPNEGALAEELRRDELLLLSAWKLPLKGSPPQAMPLKDEAAFNDQLGLLIDRGVPLVEALDVAASVVREEARGKIMKLREQVAAGESFAGACEKVGGFDGVTIAVYKAAERTGDLGTAASRLAIALRRRLGIRGKAVTVMIYPLIVMSIGLIMGLGLLTFVIPMYGEQLTQMGGHINPFSRVVFAMGNGLRDHFGIALGVLLGLGLGGFLLRELLGAALIGLAQRLPAMSRLLLTIEMARFFSVMAAMVKSGVPLADALGTSTMVISVPRLREQLDGLRRGLVEGGVWRTLVEEVQALPLATRKLLVAAERSGDLDSALDVLAVDLADEVDTRSARMLAMLEPAAIVLMFLLIVPLILAIAIPLLTARIDAG